MEDLQIGPFWAYDWWDSGWNMKWTEDAEGNVLALCHFLKWSPKSKSKNPSSCPGWRDHVGEDIEGLPFKILWERI
ncbi:unnamed protein product [Blepharisma stoltei]|uniref:Uncharacterized protein n=1 Tax=Blepharisma stoltei TaxID=1481888 RepID=A0AAU9JMB3_9CILI|nr:unnamed protein product [Blepharisma stoltei]